MDLQPSPLKPQVNYSSHCNGSNRNVKLPPKYTHVKDKVGSLAYFTRKVILFDN